ncbi:MAG: ion transporter [Cyanobacteria bacterium J06641_5]
MQQKSKDTANPISLRQRLRETLFDPETRVGKACSIALLGIIAASILAVSLESVEPIACRYGQVLRAAETAIAILFVLEYGTRIYIARDRQQFIFSFYGIVDLLSVIPWLLSLFVAATKYVTTIRVLRLLGVFRVLKMGDYIIEADLLLHALRASQRKITVFLGWILAIVLTIGSVMYVIEGNSNSAFNSIPRSVYWAIVTVTTVGYGDIAPTTTLGQFLSATLMILGYGILAVPTGIVSAEIVQAPPSATAATRVCSQCKANCHDADARHCKYCGAKLDTQS